MTAFCVFGVTMANCVVAAERRVPAYDKTLKRELTTEEWRSRVNELAGKMFADTAKPRQISPAFDAPQFADDWIRVAHATSAMHSPSIRVRGQKIDAKGAPVLKKGDPVISWVPYLPQRMAA